jgi:hypothetical protein
MSVLVAFTEIEEFTSGNVSWRKFGAEKTLQLLFVGWELKRLIQGFIALCAIQHSGRSAISLAVKALAH